MVDKCYEALCVLSLMVARRTSADVSSVDLVVATLPSLMPYERPGHRSLFERIMLPAFGLLLQRALAYSLVMGSKGSYSIRTQSAYAIVLLPPLGMLASDVSWWRCRSSASSMEGSTSALAVQVSRLRCVKMRPEPRTKRSYLTFRDHFYVCIVSNYMRTVLSTARKAVL